MGEIHRETARYLRTLRVKNKSDYNQKESSYQFKLSLTSGLFAQNILPLCIKAEADLNSASQVWFPQGIP